jgi:membrane-associated protease RseP (regulator of RpoE activity)
VAAGVVGTIVAPFAWVATAAVHELGHAVAAWSLGQTVTRIVIGEGRAIWQHGRDPRIVIGSVVMGNALTNVMDLRPDGYRTRAALVLLAAPIASAVIGLFVLMAGVGQPMGIEAAAVLFAFFSLAMTVITLIPVPTFGGRVWSDLASALYLLRASEPELEEHMLMAAQDRIVVLLETGAPEQAIRTGRRAVEAAPRAPHAYGLLAYALHHAGRVEEAATVARSALVLAENDAMRAYLRQFIGAPMA